MRPLPGAVVLGAVKGNVFILKILKFPFQALPVFLFPEERLFCEQLRKEAIAPAQRLVALTLRNHQSIIFKIMAKAHYFREIAVQKIVKGRQPVPVRADQRRCLAGCEKTLSPSREA